MGILCISMGQPASLARRISADTTWGQRDFYGDDNLDDDDFDDLDGDDDDRMAIWINSSYCQQSWSSM